MRAEVKVIEEMTVEELAAEIAKCEEALAPIKAEWDAISEEKNHLDRRLNSLREQKFRLESPFGPGDVVEDEFGVRYRIVELGTRLIRRSEDVRYSAIRLSKNGVEAHKDPRPLRSKRLTKVEFGGTE